jgi:hypothetical protein
MRLLEKEMAPRVVQHPGARPKRRHLMDEVRIAPNGEAFSGAPHEGTVAVPLGGKRAAVVDAADWEKVGGHRWQEFKSRNTSYAVRYVRVFMHREILDTEEEVDHKNGDGLDNRRANLRPASRSQNAQNQPKQNRATSSRFKGVHWNTREEKWVARVGINGKRVYLGSFHSEEDAARAYDAAAQERFGEYAHLNFPRVPHPCNDGWVTVGQLVDDPETGEEVEEHALYPCHRCAEEGS